MSYILFSVITALAPGSGPTVSTSQITASFETKEACQAAVAEMIPTPTKSAPMRRELVEDKRKERGEFVYRIQHVVFCVYNGKGGL